MCVELRTKSIIVGHNSMHNFNIQTVFYLAALFVYFILLRSRTHSTYNDNNNN